MTIIIRDMVVAEQSIGHLYIRPYRRKESPGHLLGLLRPCAFSNVAMSSTTTLTTIIAWIHHGINKQHGLDISR